MFAVLKREFRSYFQNVIGWLFVAALMALFGLYFYVYNLRQGYPYLYYTLSAITIIFMIAVPILTMRSFAEDRKNKTDQLMLTAPVPVAKVVLGKYLAMLAVFTVDIAVFCVTPLILRAFGTIPMGESYIAILAFWLYGAASIAVGMFISALTESQVIAAVLTFVVLFISYMMQSLTGLISSDGNWLTKILNCLDLYAPFEKFQGGCLDITAILYYVTVIVLFNFFTVQAIQKRRWSISKKTFSLSVFSSSFIVVVFALAVVANLAVDALPTRITSVDCSYSKLYSITKDTKKTMKKLKSDVTIYVLAAEKSKDAQIDSMLERYKDLSGHIRVKYVNPKSKPYFYKDYTDNAPTSNSLIVVSDKRSKVIDYYDIYDYQSNMDYSTYSYNNELKGFDAEGQITSAIAYVTSENLPVMYTLEGHGEQEIDSTIKEDIEKANMEIKSLNLLTEGSVPEDAGCLLIDSPTTDISEDEKTALIDYLENGGKAMIFSDYTGEKMENFDAVLENYGVSRVDGLVFEGDAQHYAAQMPYYLVPTVNSTDITSDVSSSGYYILMPYAQVIQKSDDVRDTVNIESLLTTSDSAYSKTDLNSGSLEKEDGDVEGPFDLGVSITETVDDDKETRIIYYSTSNLLQSQINQMVSGGNEKLVMTSLSSLVDTEDSTTVSIPSKSLEVSYLTLTAYDASFWKICTIGLIPGVFLLIGFMIWLKRRKA